MSAPTSCRLCAEWPQDQREHDVGVFSEPPSQVRPGGAAGPWLQQVEASFTWARADSYRTVMRLARHLAATADVDGLTAAVNGPVAVATDLPVSTVSRWINTLVARDLLQPLGRSNVNGPHGQRLGKVMIYQLWWPGAVAAELPLVSPCSGPHRPELLEALGPTVLAQVPPGLRDGQRDVPPAMRSSVLARDGHCLACGATCCLVADHALPHACGGRTILTNLQTLCMPCNQRKKVRYLNLLLPDLSALGALEAALGSGRDHARAAVTGSLFDARWEAMLSRVLEQRHGPSCWPVAHTPEWCWIMRQRRDARRGSLPAERAARLAVELPGWERRLHPAGRGRAARRCCLP